MTETVKILDQENVFKAIRDIILEGSKSKKNLSVALTGGSTPKAFYKWAMERKHFSEHDLGGIVWTVSDERCVPLSSEDSNFGNADRILLKPLGIAENNKRPWQTELDPEAAAQAFNEDWCKRFGDGAAFDICFLGMGDDGHTASIFPGSPLLEMHGNKNFAAVDVPGKGWRLSITPEGLKQCGHIVVVVTGANKAEMLKTVFEEKIEIKKYPVQLLRTLDTKVTWLIDHEAGSLLEKAGNKI